MTIEGTTRTSCANVASAHAAIVEKAPEETFRKVYEATERNAHGLGPTVPVRHPLEASPELERLPRDEPAFAVFVEANRRTESGGAGSLSMLLTTAGPEHRASFGVAQLTTREHLSLLARLDDRALGRIGTTRAELESMRSRGDSAIAYYHLLVDGASPETSRATLRLSREDSERAGRLAEAGDVPGLSNLLGRAFTEDTGLPASALGEIVATRALRSRDLRADFRAQYERDHGDAFAPEDRDPARMMVTARHLALAHPELDGSVRALGSDDAGALALGHYLGVGDTAENMLGWHARAASTAVGTERLRAILSLADPITSRARESDDFSRALAATAGVADLEGDARVLALARLGRIFHGAPARARERFFVDGHLDAPRFRSRVELETAIGEMREGRAWSDERLLGHVSDILAERRTA